MKGIKVGQYKHWIDGTTQNSFSSVGGTNSWDDKIRTRKMQGIMMDVILVPKFMSNSEAGEKKGEGK